MVGQELFIDFYGVFIMKEVEIKITGILGNKEWYRVKDLSQILSMGESTIWKMVRNNNFPKPQKITERLTIWTRKSIFDWVRSKTNGLDDSNNHVVTEALVNDKDGAGHE